MWRRAESRVGEYQALPLFEGCSPSELRRVSGCATRLSARPGAVLVREGHRRGQFVIVLGGTAEVWRGGRQIDEITAGGYFGEIVLLRGIREPATIVARTETSIDVIAGQEFAALYADLELVRHRIEYELEPRLANWHQAAGLTLEQRDVVDQRLFDFRPSRPRTVTSGRARSGRPRCPIRR